MRRRIIVTGGGTGIGRAIAERFLPEHPELILIGRREQPLADAAAALRSADPDSVVSTYSCDLMDPDAVQALAAQIADGGRVDVLVANAGGNFGLQKGDLHQVAANWRADFDGNVLPTVLLTEALLDHFTRPGGRIVAMSSIAALRGSSSYGGAKAAVDAWALWMAGRLAADGITVNVVAPGFVPATDFWRERIEQDPKIVADRTAPIPMNRPGTPQEVAAAVAYLADQDAGWTTGQILQINGGTLLGRG